MVLDIKHLIALIFVGILGANSASAEPVAPLLDEYLNRYRSTPQEQRSFEFAENHMSFPP